MNNMTVGTKEKATKAVTSFVLSLAPRTPLFLSRTSFVTFLMTRTIRISRNNIFRLRKDIRRVDETETFQFVFRKRKYASAPIKSRNSEKRIRANLFLLPSDLGFNASLFI